MALTDPQNIVLAGLSDAITAMATTLAVDPSVVAHVVAAFAGTICAAAAAVSVDPAVYAQKYGTGGTGLVNERMLQGQAAQIRLNSQAASAAAEAQAQILEAKARTIDAALMAHA